MTTLATKHHNSATDCSKVIQTGITGHQRHAPLLDELVGLEGKGIRGILTSKMP